MIHLVDEDHLVLGAYVWELELRGLRVTTYSNAADAFRALWDAPADRIQAALIDVMLAPGELIDGSPADLGELAGPRLLRDLSQQNPAAFPARAILFTAAIGPHLDEARACATEHGTPLWDKRSFASPVEFGDRLEAFIAGQGVSP